MNPSKLAFGTALAAWLLSTLPGAAAITEGTTADGRRYVTGGIGSDEVATLQSQAAAFSLQLVTAARGGAYLADTHVRITGPGNNVVLDTTISGPWLLIDLPGGRYTVRARHSAATVERAITITPGRSQRVVLHFDAVVDQEGPALPKTGRAESVASPPSPMTSPSMPSSSPASGPASLPPPPPPPR